MELRNIYLIRSDGFLRRFRVKPISDTGLLFLVSFVGTLQFDGGMLECPH